VVYLAQEKAFFGLGTNCVKPKLTFANTHTQPHTVWEDIFAFNQIHSSVANYISLNKRQGHLS